MRHLDLLTAIYSRWLKANALPEISADKLIMELWKRAPLTASDSSMRYLKIRAQLLWLDRFCALWQMAEARHQNSRELA